MGMDLNTLTMWEKDRMKRRNKNLKKLRSGSIICLMILFFFITIMTCLGWILHTVFPPTPHTSHAPNSTQEHTYHDLPPHEQAHRLALQNNTFIQMLHYTHQASNSTNCWICGHLPPHQKKGGMPLFPFPFSYNGTCEAWFALITADDTTPTSCPDGNNSCKNGWPWGNLNRVLNAVCYPNEDGNPQASGTVLESEEYKQGNMTMSYKMLNTKPKKNAGPPFISVSPVKGHLCIQKNGSVPLGHSDCHTTISFEDRGKSSFLASRHTYFVCDQTAYVQLPLNWGGTCYIAFLLPPVFVAPSTYHRDLLVPHVRHKRTIDTSLVDQTETSWEQYTDFNKGFFFFVGPVQNSKLIRRLTRTLEAVVNQTASALGSLTQEQSAIRLVTLQNHLVLDIILADRGGACKIIGSSCCIFIPDNSPSVCTAITKLHKIAVSLHQEPGTWTWSDWFWKIISSWGWQLLSAAGIIFLIITGCCLCIQCGPALCGLCAANCIPKPLVQQRERERIMLQECIDDLMQIEI
ncbi:endogenous retrovirus group V member 1 Env polyprotein-like [Lissotriton helveticus]